MALTKRTYRFFSGFPFGALALLGSALIFSSPALAGSWRPTGSLNTARCLHTATLLLDGKVLVAGGRNGPVYLTSAELYDPATETWSATGSLGTAREDHTATLLQDGRVLVLGGFGVGGFFASGEVYDSAFGTWSPAGGLFTARCFHTATLLDNGWVLVAGARMPVANLPAPNG